jgi:hypothetical protein
MDVLNWHLLAERRILDAMERGEFDDLAGKGKPLEWHDEGFVPLEWRLAFHLLKQADLAPEWIMRDVEIREDLASLEDKRRQGRLWMEERRAVLATMSPEECIAERARLREAQGRTWERTRDFIEKLNQKIADFNLVVPIVWLQRQPVDLAEEQAALRAAWGLLDEEE